MTFFEIILISVGLAMDAAAVSLAAAAAGFANDARAVFRLSFHFGLFQFLMPVMGWFMGIGFASHFKAVDHWIAMALLGIVGIRMIQEGSDHSTDDPVGDPSRGMTMVMLSVATSIDALAVGLSLSMLDINIWYPAAMIGVVTVAMSFLSTKLGIRLGKLFGKHMTVAGGVLLILIGGRILFTHLEIF
ncbi:Putative Mn2+ efflux pump MntP [Desulfocicer vacuolatum DSM 3385]|uniref:Putative manganese efflux pump MntP n=1 Tax=Desulfocicer vacuolatum DSM 3385 TaxID=1121400 RepID=A0A1W2C734_9BACT|nr:manganese efflux pump MntP family protein [Desulfocicer vacuolatum]SMC80940.1 Putative Mn2+ efflux pump MntP [Desulfocicer vacuolatum DSM 3385]